MLGTHLWSKHIGPVSSGFMGAGLRVLCTFTLALALCTAFTLSLPVEAQTPPGPTPEATITATPTCGEAPLNVCFSATATGLDPQALPWTYTWDFGDGTYPTPNVNDALPCHAFMTPNTQYTVTVTIEDTNFTVATGSTMISTNPLTVSACADVTNGPAPLLVQFNDGCVIISGGVPPYSVEWDFGDGSAKCYDWATQHAFDQPGTYYTSVKVTDSCSPPSVVVDTHLVITVTQLTVSVNATSDRLCGPEGTLVCFSGQAQGGVGPYTYTWNFGDGSPTVNVQSPCHTYDTAGVYTVSLTATDSLSSTDTDSHLQVVITQPLSVTTSVSRTSGFAPFTAYFTSSITGGTGPYTYLWDFGDGETSDLGSPSHVYDNPGYYTVKLTVTDSCVPSASASDDHIKLGIYPIEVTAEGNQPCGYAPLNEIFTGTATGGVPPYTYSWDFGDGTSGSSLQNPSHSYLVVGNYTAVLTVRDSMGTTGTGTFDVSVTDPLSVTASASVMQGPAPLTVNVSSAVTGGTPPYTYDWNFADGSQHSTSPADQHSWADPGTYAVTLTVNDSCGHNESSVINIDAWGDVMPSASANATCGYAPSNIQFSGSASGGVAPYTYAWDFGDGSAISNQQNPDHGYDSPGVYAVTLTVTDSQAHSGVDSQLTISVTDPMVVTVQASETQGAAPFKVNLGSTVVGGTPPYTYSWDYGDGTTGGVEATEQHIYGNEGQYTVTLTVSDSCGHKTSKSIAIDAYGPVTASADVNQPCGYAPLNEIFTGAGAGGVPPYTYSWSFGDGTAGSDLQNPSHSYLAVGTYTAVLTVTDHNGATATGSVDVDVTESLTVVAMADLTEGPAPLTVNFSSTVSGGLPPYTYDWDFADGSQHSTSPADQHTMIDSGLYDVTLQVTDSCGHTTTGTVSINAFGPVVPTPEVNQPCGYAPLNVIFTGDASGGVPPYTYAWDFGDGTSGSNLQEASHSYLSVGNYSAVLTVTDSVGNTGAEAVSVSVTNPLSVTPAASTTQGLAPLTVDFSSTVTGGTPPYTYEWDFGDGSQHSTSSAVQHTLIEPDKYSVTLTVADSCGHSVTEALSINAYDAMTATATATPACGTVPLNACFTSQVAGGVPPYTYSWNFGDGGALSTDTSPCHDFLTAGTYDVTVTATDSIGNHITSAPVQVEVVLPFNLIVMASASAIKGMVPMDVSFTSSVSGGAAPYTYDWDFGDGTPHVPAANPEHVYTQTGTFTVTLTVTSADACGKVYTASDSHLTITVLDGPTINITSPTPNAHFGASVPFTSYVFDDVPVVRVDYFVNGNFVGSSGSASPYTFVWNTPGYNGSYSVTATVHDSLGRSATSGSVSFSVGNPILLGRVIKHGGPFRLKIFGNYFQPGCVVKIDGVAVPQSKFKGSTAVVAKKGSALKAMVPKGMSVVITVTNPDGGVSNGITFTR